MARRRTAGSAATLKTKRERRYGMERKLRTEFNRRRKRLKHLKAHPNNIRGMEHIRKALGFIT